MSLPCFYCRICNLRTFYETNKPNFCQCCGASYDALGKSTPRVSTVVSVSTAKVIEEKPATKIVWASEYRSKQKGKRDSASTTENQDNEPEDSEEDSQELVSNTPVSELKINSADFIVEKEETQAVSLSEIMRSNTEKTSAQKPKRKYTKRAKKTN